MFGKGLTLFIKEEENADRNSRPVTDLFQQSTSVSQLIIWGLEDGTLYATKPPGSVFKTQSRGRCENVESFKAATDLVALSISILYFSGPDNVLLMTWTWQCTHSSNKVMGICHMILIHFE